VNPHESTDDACHESETGIESNRFQHPIARILIALMPFLTTATLAGAGIHLSQLLKSDVLFLLTLLGATCLGGVLAIVACDLLVMRSLLTRFLFAVAQFVAIVYSVVNLLPPEK